MDDFVNTVFDHATNHTTGIMDASAAYPLLMKVSTTRRKTNCMLFHFSMWLTTNDMPKYTVLIPATGNPVSERDAPHYILFGNKKDRTNFTKWLNQYKKWFQNEEIENSNLPELPISGSHTLHILRHNTGMYDIASGSESFSGDFIKLWTWIIKNCKRPVYVLSKNSFAFTDAKEAIHFKLYWADDLIKKEA